MRTIIEVPDDIVKSLDEVGHKENRSRAALIREAIVEFLEKRSLSAKESAFGIWKGKQADGVRYQESLRSEWDNK